jgi:hypothetical protein
MKKKDMKKWLYEYKRTLKCEMCGYPGSRCPGAIHFHHRDGDDKVNTVAFLIKNGFSLEKVQAEIAKCQALCSNCHAEVHYAERFERPVHPNCYLGVTLPDTPGPSLFPEDGPTGPVRVNGNKDNRYNWGRKVK